MTDGPRTIDAVRVTCGILDLLQDRDAAGVTDIADELDRSKSSIHAYLTTLVEQQYVVKRDGQYALSLRYLDLAEHVKDHVGNYDVIRSEIDELASVTDEVAQFGTLEQGDLVYLYKGRGESGVETMSAIGSRETPHSTGLGKAMLSQLSEDRVRQLLGSAPLARKTENTITNLDELVVDLQETRERGYAIDDEENIVGLRCIAAPVVLDDGTVIGAVSVSGPSSRMTVERIQTELAERVKRAANVIQINTKFSEGGPAARTGPRGIVAAAGGGPGTGHDSGASPATDTGTSVDVTDPDEELDATEAVLIQPVHSGKSLAIPDGATADETRLQQGSDGTDTARRFTFDRQADGSYRIDAVHSGKAIEVQNASTFDGATIQQNTWFGGDHQEWRVKPVGDGAEVRFVNENSGKVLDVAAQSTEDGAAVVQWNWNGGANQRFTLSRTGDRSIGD